MNDAILSARGLRKNYLSGDRPIAVLRGVDLDLAQGESVSIRGESGSGKSTLLHVLAGLDRPESGTSRRVLSEMTLGAFSLLSRQPAGYCGGDSE